MRLTICTLKGARGTRTAMPVVERARIPRVQRPVVDTQVRRVPDPRRRARTARPTRSASSVRRTVRRVVTVVSFRIEVEGEFDPIDHEDRRAIVAAPEGDHLVVTHRHRRIGQAAVATVAGTRPAIVASAYASACAGGRGSGRLARWMPATISSSADHVIDADRLAEDEVGQQSGKDRRQVDEVHRQDGAGARHAAVPAEVGDQRWQQGDIQQRRQVGRRRRCRLAGPQILEQRKRQDHQCAQCDLQREERPSPARRSSRPQQPGVQAPARVATSMIRSPRSSCSRARVERSPRAMTISTPSNDSAAPTHCRRRTGVAKNAAPTSSVRTGAEAPISVALTAVDVCSARYCSEL